MFLPQPDFNTKQQNLLNYNNNPEGKQQQQQKTFVFLNGSSFRLNIHGVPDNSLTSLSSSPSPVMGKNKQTNKKQGT